MTLVVQVRDFGPIAKADIELRPLTVLIGPNNSGKSVVAMLTYAITQAAASALGHRSLVGPIGRRIRASEEVDADLRRLLDQRKQDAPRGRPRPATREWLQESAITILTQFARNTAMQIERSFSTHLPELSRTTSRSRRPLTVTMRSEVGWSVKLRCDEEPSYDVARTPSAMQLLHRVFDEVEASPMRRYAELGDITPVFVHLLPSVLLSEFPSESYYLPAERSGILQSHRQLASFVVRQAPFVGIEDLQVPRMSGVVSDFVSNLLQLDSDEEREFSPLASELERKLLEGQIAIEPDPNGYPDLAYRYGSGAYPLHRSSSMVSEVAPIVVYLRYLLDAGEYLIIEEPESHLHPKSQMALAEVVVQMVRGGLTVALTTHSDYFLGQLNNSVRRATLQGRSSSSPPDSSRPSLTAADVAAYLFSRQEAATHVCPIQVTPEDGISEDEFTRVAEDLYEETVRLEEAITD